MTNEALLKDARRTAGLMDAVYGKEPNVGVKFSGQHLPVLFIKAADAEEHLHGLVYKRRTGFWPAPASKPLRAAEAVITEKLDHEAAHETERA